MKVPFSTKKAREKAILVALIQQGEDAELVQGHIDELSFLAQTLEIQTIKTYTQRLEQPNPKTFVGKGKLNEIRDFVKENEVDIIIFDDDLSPSQVRNLENSINGSQIKDAKCKILDRSLLILDIFALRAKTAQAKSQVELAQYQYMLPRLTRMWTHLSKQKGGIGMRGPGEKELETDRRIIRDKITLLQKKLEKIDGQNTIRRKNRRSQIRVALVGYTNVGKSTLMRALAKDNDVKGENKLFATLDSTVRKVVLESTPFLLTDTVGFIRKLPTTLIECFKSTLDEVREADILLHVVDISTPYYEEQINIVNQTLLAIEAQNKPTILVFNKLDKYRKQENLVPLDKLVYPKLEQQKEVFISLQTKENLDILRKILLHTVKETSLSYQN